MFEFETGVPSEDTVSSKFEMVADSQIWSDFITFEEDLATFSYKFKIAPTSNEHNGRYQILLELTDNGSDSKDGPAEDFYGDEMT